MAYPAAYKYTKEHEWISVEGTAGTVGITDYAQSSLGDIVSSNCQRWATRWRPGKIFGLGGEREGGERSVFAGVGHGGRR